MRTWWMMCLSTALVLSGCGSGQGDGSTSATTSPGSTPSATACSADAAPDRAGDATQPRPSLPDWYRLAAMDPTSRRVIVGETGFVPEGAGQSTVQRVWAFDVCTNAWSQVGDESQPAAEGRPAMGQFVTDPASGTVLALVTGLSPVWNWAPAAGSWSALPTTGGGSDTAWPKAAYDTTAGQVLAFDPNVMVADRATGVLAHHADTNKWTVLEAADGAGPDLPSVRMDQYDLAYDSAAQRLILVITPEGSAEGPGQTWAFDPRTATWTRGADIPDTLDGGYPAGGWATAFDPATGRTWLFADTAMLGYDARADDWVVAQRDAGWPESMMLGGVEVDPMARSVDSMVLDPVNGRFVVFGGFVRAVGDPVGGFVEEGSMLATDDVWAYNPTANTWTMLLAPSETPASFGPG